MISFKQFLTEARLAPLYHATSYQKAKGIVNDNLMKPGYSDEPGLKKKTVSLTRNFTFAKNWLHEMGYMMDGVIFEIDQQKLSHNYRIVPYSYFGTPELGYMKSARQHPLTKTNSPGKDFNFNNQHEEAVIGAIKNFKKYITGIYVVGSHRVDDFRDLDVPIYSYNDSKKRDLR